MSVPKCLFFQDLEGLTEVFRRMSAGISGQKLLLWAEFSFLIFILAKLLEFLAKKGTTLKKARESLTKKETPKSKGERRSGSGKL